MPKTVQTIENHILAHFHIFGTILNGCLAQTSSFNRLRLLFMIIQVSKLLLRYLKSPLKSVFKPDTCQTDAVYVKNCSCWWNWHFSAFSCFSKCFENSVAKTNDFKCLLGFSLAVQVSKVLLRYHKSLLKSLAKSGTYQIDANNAKSILKWLKITF